LETPLSLTRDHLSKTNPSRIGGGWKSYNEEVMLIVIYYVYLLQ